MSRQGKTRRRLLFLLGGSLGLVALAGGGALFRRHHIQQRALQGRTEGLAAMARGDYPNALVQLGTYLSRNTADVQILLPYAKARRLVEEPNGHHLGQAISLYQRILELSPGLPEAQDNLLELYSLVGYNPEAIALADAILARSPADTNALRLKIISLVRMQRLDQAETAVQHLTEIAPLNLDFHILQIQIMLQRGNQNRVEPYAAALAQAHPGDVHFILLQSIAASAVGDKKTAANVVGPLATRPQPDAAYTRLLVHQLDSLELFSDAFTALQQAVKDNPSPDMAKLWVRRLYETNRLPLLVDQTAALDPSATTSDPEIVAMRALALLHLDRRPEAVQLTAALNKRGQTEPAAAHWASALDAVTRSDASDPVKSIALLKEAIAANPGNAILALQLGDAYAAAGARDKARALWSDVARTEPAWSAPVVRLSQTLAAAGQPADALAAATLALRRAPEDYDVAVNFITASAALLPEGPSADATKLLAQIASVRQKFPKNPDLLPLQAGILLQVRQKDAALQIFRAVLASDPAASEHVLLSLAVMSQSFKLDQEEACFAASEKAHGLTAQLAFARARWLFGHQKEKEGLAFLEQARAGHPADDVPWRNVWAAYLDLLADPRAKSEWIALGDGNPENAQLQWAALSARSVQGDHDFTGRTLDRLGDLIGSDDLELRLRRARWLLEAPSTDKDATQASILLSDISRKSPEMPAPRLLLATCYMRLGNVSGAIDQLTAVSDLQPDQPGIALELARLLQARGDFSGARKYIDRAIASKAASVQNKRQAASLLALLGDYPAALTLLEKAYAGSDPPPDLVLAALYRQLNQPQKAEAICRRLLEKPDVLSVAFCADFYASQGRMDEAQHTLALLDAMALSPGSKELVLADFATKHGSPDQALKQFQAATKAAPKLAIAWQELVTYYLASGKIDDALAAANQAASLVSDSSEFDALRKNATLVKDASGIPGTGQLLTMLVGTSADNEPVLDALRIVLAAQQQKTARRETAAKLQQLADRNPRILALQTITLQYLMDAGQIDEAVKLSTRTVQSFPTAALPLRLATSALGAAQQWDQALVTAKEWQHTGSGATLDADLAVASAEIHLGDTSAASQQIQPYLERAINDPEKYSGVILVRTQQLLAAHQPAQVEALLRPLLPKSARWRALWLTLAAGSLDDPALAQTWLEQVTPLIPDNPAEKTDLALAWVALGNRSSNADRILKGKTLLESVVQSPDAPEASLLAWGTLCESSSDLTGAEHAYRRVLQLDPTSAIALNNLASVLVKGHGNLQEAQQLVTRALAIFPNAAPFLDTKATVQASLKDYSGAVASLKDAQRNDPNNLEWHINLLAVLVDSGQPAAARTELQQIASALPAASNLSPEVRKRYESLRLKLQ